MYIYTHTYILIMYSLTKLLVNCTVCFTALRISAEKDKIEFLWNETTKSEKK